MTGRPSMDMEWALKMLGDTKEMERAELLYAVRVGDGYIHTSEFF